MRCPACHDPDSRVIDSRTAADAIRRRRSCQACSHRFTTLERIEQRLPWILKKHGQREPFDADKVLHGISLACRKRHIDPDTLQRAVKEVEQRLVALRSSEVSSLVVGQIVMEVLRDVDAVAYVRFASVYQEFESVAQFTEAILPLKGEPDAP